MKNPAHPVMAVMMTLLLSAQVQADRVIIWHQKENGTQTLQSLLRPVSEEHDVEFAITYISTNDLKSALISSAYNKNQPHIALIPSDFFGEYRSFSPLPVPDSLIARVDLAPDVWNLSKVGDKIYGIPLYTGNHMLMYYNKAMVKTPATRWEDIQAFQQRLPPGKKAIGWNYGELFWFIHFISAFNAYPVADNTVTLDNANVATGLQFYHDLRENGVISSSCDYTCSMQRFAKQEYAYALNGDWAYRILKEQMGDKLGVAELPSIKGTPMKSYYSAIALVFLGRDSKAAYTQLDEAILDRLLEEDAYRHMFSHHGLIPASKAMRDKLTVTQHPDYQKIYEVLNNAIPLSSSPAMSAAWSGMRKGLDYFHAGNVTPQRATQVMQRVADRELQRLQGGK